MTVEERNNEYKSPEELFRELIEILKEYDQREESVEFLQKAFSEAVEAHKDQRRASGEPYIIHPLEAAKILAEIRMDVPTITAALLHDIIEDTSMSYKDVEEKFGKTVADLVEGVTKLTAISSSNEAIRDKLKKPGFDKQAENLRKIFLAMAKDIRVILIKVADRLHNMRTLEALPEHKQKNIARETLEIYAPITGRLGMWEFKWQFENLSFYYLHPEEYKTLSDEVSRRISERKELVLQVKDALENVLHEVGLTDAQVDGRSKHLYSIFKKMKTRNISLDEVYDLLAVRVIVNTVRECYQVLGIVHNLWMPFQDRFKDYIAMPKSNNYRSLHTTVYGPGNLPVEVQIRTSDMHAFNEFGIAAHWAYKEGYKGFDVSMFNEVYPWIRRILDWKDESRDAREYIENLKLDLLESEVFVFSPKGEVIDLPAGSTPIDFAYRIHTEVGHRCIGAKVNSKIVPLEYKLKNADIVEILTSKHGSPSRDWLKIAKSPQARNKIRQWFKRERRDENITQGKEAIERELKRHRMDVSLNNTELFSKIAERYNHKSIDDLFASVGYGETSPVTVFNRLRELAPEKLPKPAETSPEAQKKKKKRKSKTRYPVKIAGLDNPMVKYAKCCNPVKGDDVFGYVTMGRGVSIHRKDCPNYEYLMQQPERIVNVEWIDREDESTFNVVLEINAWDRPGLLSDVMNVTSEFKFKIDSAKAWARGEKAIIKLSINVPSREAIENLSKHIRRIKNVNKVFRVSKKNM
ncbi:MAG: RelA/SpoT family protein [Vulcanimicrobiota bacterium]